MNAEVQSDGESEIVALRRADAAANRAVEEEGSGLQAALEAGNVAAVEDIFYRVFRRVYLVGVMDGRNAR